jgi:hypothetical protein
MKIINFSVILILSMLHSTLGNVIQDMIDQGKANGDKYIRIPVSFCVGCLRG